MNTTFMQLQQNVVGAKSKGIKMLQHMLWMFVLLCFGFNETKAQTITIDGNSTDWNAANFNLFTYRQYAPDAFGNGVVDNQFTEGSKDFFFANQLVWSISQTKAKNDIANAAAIINNNILYFAGDRTSNNGDAQIGFWLYLNGTGPVTVNGNNVFSPPHTDGDILVLADFTGGGRNATVTIYQWDASGNGNVPNTNGNLRTTNLVGTVAENNGGAVPVPTGWSYLSTSYETNAFYEGQVDLGPLNLPSLCNASFLLETRSSQSITASLDDFVAGQFNITPAPPTVTSPSNCGPWTGNLASLVNCASPQSSVRIYTQAEGGSPLANTQVTVNSTTTYYASCFRTLGQTVCESARVPFTVTINPNPAAPTLGKTDPTCTVATGCVTVTSSTAGLTFSFNGGAFVAYPAGGWCGLAAGSVNKVIAKNAQGCISPEASITLAAQPPTPAAPTLGKTDPTCTVATGCVTVTSSTAGLTFSLNGGAFAAYPAGGWCGLAAGSVNKVRAQNAQGCISPEASITLAAQPPTPAAPTLGKTDPTCTVATGCVTVTSSTAGLTFSLNGGAFAAYPAGGWCGLAAGSVNKVRAQNAQGCISPEAEITLAAQPPTPAAPTLGKTDPTCTVATGCVTVTSSTAGLTFSLNGGAFAAYPAGGWCGLAAGSVNKVRAQNAQGCISPEASITLAAQPPTPAAPTLGKTDPTCTVATGCVTVTSSTAGLTFSLNGGAFAAYPAGGWCGLAAGSVNKVRAQNAQGCISPEAEITLAAQPPTPAAPTLGKTDPTCTVATGCVTVTSSTAGLTFSLNGGAFAAYPAGGWCGLAAGSVNKVRAQNAQGCISPEAEITLAAQPPTPAAPTLGKTDPTCTVATGCVTVTSSTAGLTFSLNGGAFAAYPAGGWCGLAAGSVNKVRAQNAQGCISPEASITLAAQPPTPAAPTLGKTDPTCTVATGCVTVTSSTAGLTFSLNGGAFAAYPAGGWCGLAAGSVNKVRAQNAQGCISPEAEITLAAQPPTPAAPTLGKTDPTCTVATGCVTVTSSTAGLTFSLNGGAFAAYPAGGWCGLAAGSVNKVRAQNAQGCISPEAEITLAAQPPTPAAPTLGKTDPTCTVATGCVTVTSSTAGLTFSLNGGAFAAYPAGGWCGLAAGSVNKVRAQNAQGCISPEASITLAAQPPTPAAPTLGKTDPTCTVATGCVTVTSSTAGLTFSLNGGAFAAYPAGGWCGLAAGSTHKVRAQNAQGCISPEASITLGTQPPTPSCSIVDNGRGPICLGEGDVSVERGFSGPAGLSTYKWTVEGDLVIKGGIDNLQTVTLIVSGVGKLKLTVTNSFGCSSNCSYDVIAQSPGLCIAEGPAKVCAASENVYSTGAGAAGYKWTITGDGTISGPDNGATVKVIAGASGSYTLKVVVDNGPFTCPSYCSITTTIEQCNKPLCSYTQGYYGNPGGIACTPDGGSTTKALIENSINNMPNDRLVLGSGLRRFEATAADATKIISILPGGGPAAILGNAPAIPGYWTPSSFPLSNQGKIRNVLLAQTLALALNVYIPNSNLGSFSLANAVNYPDADGYAWMVTVDKTGDCSGLEDAIPKECKFAPVETWCVSLGKNIITGYTVSYNPYESFGGISTKLIAALGGDKTVMDLLNFASAILGGAPLPAGVSLSDVANAAGAINEAFDECRIFVEFKNNKAVTGYCVAPQAEVCPPSITSTVQTIKPTFGVQTQRPDVQVSLVEVKEASIIAFPNPFRETINFRFVSPQNGRATLELFNVFGQRLSVIFDGEVKAHTQNNVRYSQNISNTSMLIYKLTVNGRTLTGKVQSIK